MTGFLQGYGALAIGVLFGLFLPSNMSIVVINYLPQVAEVCFIVIIWIPLRILFQDLDDLATTTECMSKFTNQILAPK